MMLSMYILILATDISDRYKLQTLFFVTLVELAKISLAANGGKIMYDLTRPATKQNARRPGLAMKP